MTSDIQPVGAEMVSPTTYVAPPFVWMIAAVVLAYLGIVGLLMNYLRRMHEDVWIELGRPAFVPDLGHVFPALRFIFGRRYRALNDPRLNVIVWSVRSFLALTLAMVALGWVSGLLPVR